MCFCKWVNKKMSTSNPQKVAENFRDIVTWIPTYLPIEVTLKNSCKCLICYSCSSYISIFLDPCLETILTKFVSLCSKDSNSPCWQNWSNRLASLWCQISFLVSLFWYALFLIISKIDSPDIAHFGQTS